MPLFYQHNINEDEKLGVWKIEENEAFFLSKVPLNADISHQHKRLQHLAGRYLLQHLFQDFPYELIEIADTRKPFLNNEAYHFSISHCGLFAAALVSRWRRVGVDIEVITPTIQKIRHKFLNEDEMTLLNDDNGIIRGLMKSLYHQESEKKWQLVVEHQHLLSESEAGNHSSVINAGEAEEDKISPVFSAENLELLTLSWGAKEAMYKWYGRGGVDFKKHMQLTGILPTAEEGWISSNYIFQKEKPVPLLLRSRFFGNVVLSYVISY